MLVCVNGVVPDEQGHSEQHRGVQILPLGVRPPQRREQGKVALLELTATDRIKDTSVPDWGTSVLLAHGRMKDHLEHLSRRSWKTYISRTLSHSSWRRLY